MKKLVLLGIGLACAAAFIGFDAVGAFFDNARGEVRSKLMSPEVEMQAQISGATELAEKCGESVVNGRIALARLDAMIQEREHELARRQKALEHDKNVLEARRTMLQDGRAVYLINTEEISRRTLNEDALLRAKAFGTDREILEHLQTTLQELKAQRLQTAAEIEDAVVEEGRLQSEIDSLHAELENLKARRAVAQTRQEAEYVFDRSAFDKARDKITSIRATIAEQNKRLDYFGRNPSRKGLIPAEATPDEDGAEAITSVLGDGQVKSETGAEVAAR
jgi:predicted  nucleic acid-binding Zn-ribbon protein